MAFGKARGHLKINPGRGVANDIEKRWNFTRKFRGDCSIAEQRVALSFLAAEVGRE